MLWWNLSYKSLDHCPSIRALVCVLNVRINMNNTLKIHLLKEARELIVSRVESHTCFALDMVHRKRTGQSLTEACDPTIKPEVYQAIESIKANIAEYIDHTWSVGYYLMLRLRKANPYWSDRQLFDEHWATLHSTRLKMIDDILESYQPLPKD